MANNRRQFLRLASGLAVTATAMSLGGRAGMAASPSTSDVEAGRRKLLSHFAGLGFSERPPLDLITLDGFNDGLRFDESATPIISGKSMSNQMCGRVEDIAKKGERGVLAGFHIFGLRNESPAFHGELLTHALDFLTRHAGLPPSRLVFVSTEWFEPYKPFLKRYGVAPAQVVQRSSVEAMAAGDGSGFFNPKGHAKNPQMPTVSIHYAIDDAAARGGVYPVAGTIELGEFSLRAGPKRDIAVEDGGFGLERLLTAQGKTVDDFEHSRQRLMAALLEESKRRGVPLPDAYGAFDAA